MHNTLFYIAIFEIIATITISVAILYFSFKLLKYIFFRKNIFLMENTSFLVFSSGIILSVGIILSTILPSISSLTQIAITQNDSIPFGDVILYSTLYLFIGFIMALLVNLSTFVLFSILTKSINEFEEIKNNNVPIAILLVSILIAMTLIIKNSIAILISTMVPYQEVFNYL